MLDYILHCISSPLLYILRYKLYKAGTRSVLFTDFAPGAKIVPGS